MIPDGWEIKKLHECCEIKGAYGSGSPSTVYTSSLPRYIRITDITDDGKLNEFSKVSVKLKENEQYTLEDGDFLFARSGATVGKTYLYRKKDGWAIYAGYLIRFKTNKNVLLPEYLEQYTQSQIYRFWVKNTLRAGAQPNINAKEYGSLSIPLPPLPEQRRIAEILSTWDEAITLTERLMAAKQRRKKALMQQLLTGKRRFGEFGGIQDTANSPQSWRTVKLEDAFERVVRKLDQEPKHILSITAGVGYVDQRKKFNKVIAGKNLEKYIWLKQGEFSYNKGNSKRYPQGCIYLLEKLNEGAVPNVYYSFKTRSSDIASNQFYKFYFENGMLNRHLKPIINAGVRNDGLLNISATEFFKVPILLPPIEEQRRIAAVLQACDEEIDLLAQKLAALQGQKKALMQQLLTGKVRVLQKPSGLTKP